MLPLPGWLQQCHIRLWWTKVKLVWSSFATAACVFWVFFFFMHPLQLQQSKFAVVPNICLGHSRFTTFVLYSYCYIAVWHTFFIIPTFFYFYLNLWDWTYYFTEMGCELRQHKDALFACSLTPEFSKNQTVAYFPWRWLTFKLFELDAQKLPALCLMNDDAERQGERTEKKMSGIQFSSEAVGFLLQDSGHDWHPYTGCGSCVHVHACTFSWVKTTSVNVGDYIVSGLALPAVLSCLKHNKLRPSFRDGLKEWGHILGKTNLLQFNDPVCQMKICVWPKKMNRK